MKLHRAVDLGVLTIRQGSANSDAMDFRGWRGGASSVTIYGPGSGLLDGTLTVQVSEDGEYWWFDQQSGGDDIDVPADGAVKVQSTAFKFLRVQASVVQTDDRILVIKGEEGE